MPSRPRAGSSISRWRPTTRPPGGCMSGSGSSSSATRRRISCFTSRMDRAGGSAGLVADATSIVRETAARDPWLAGHDLSGIGWATVELERAADELSQAFARAGLPAPAWTPGPREELLGATSWVSREWWPAPAGGPGPAIVLLEPDTEGRLAATLARFGEGVGAVYLSVRPTDAPSEG